MNKPTIFNEDEFQGLPDSEKQMNLQYYFQVFKNRKNLYSKINEEFSDVNSIQEYTVPYQSFLEGYALWNKKTHQSVEQGDINKSIQNFKEGDNLFMPMEELIRRLSPADSLLKQIELDDYKKILFESFKYNADKFIKGIDDKIDFGLAKLHDVKVEQDIRRSFSGDVKKAALYYKIGKFISLIAFMATIIILMLGLTATYIEPQLYLGHGYSLAKVGEDNYNGLALRLSIALPLIWLAYIFNNLYKYYHVAAAKYDHLDRLLHDGSRALVELLEGDETAIALTRKRLSELFLEIDTTTNIVSTAKHPNEKALKAVTDALNKLHEDISKIKI